MMIYLYHGSIRFFQAYFPPFSLGKLVGAFYMPKTNNYIEIAVGVCRVANYTEYISQFARWPYYNLELINMFRANYDKFQRWLKRFKPEYFDKYEKGYGRGEIDVQKVSFGYHLWYKGELLGTLIER